MNLPALGRTALASYVDRYRQISQPSASQLLDELKTTAWACVNINAATCASYPPRLFVRTRAGQPEPKCATRPPPRLLQKSWQDRYGSGEQIQEVTDHPILQLFADVNPIHNSFDLWELTQIYLETVGKAFWHLQTGDLGIPEAIWPLPAQAVTPRSNDHSTNIIDYYDYSTSQGITRIPASEVLFFRYPNPRDPYLSGLSPLTAAYEQTVLASHYQAFKIAKFENRAIPDAVVSPEDVISSEERDRLENSWNQKLRKQGAGKIIVGESKLKVDLLAHSMGDLAALADAQATKEDIANAFCVPIAYFTKETNLANLQAAEQLHMSKAINPRLRRRDQAINEKLLPIYDPSGRLFVCSEDPIPENREFTITQERQDLELGVITINELRISRGLPKVPWGDEPQWRKASDRPL
jgi:HK97 family phage portal protein